MQTPPLWAPLAQPFLAALFHPCALCGANASTQGYVGAPLIAAVFHLHTVFDASTSHLGCVGAPLVAATFYRCTMIRGFPNLCPVADVHPAAEEETQWVMVVLVLKACAGRSRSVYNCPLYGCLYADCRKLHHELMIWELCAGAVRTKGSPIQWFW